MPRWSENSSYRQKFMYMKPMGRSLDLSDCRETIWQEFLWTDMRAMEFYLREGFSVLSEDIDEATGETDIVLSWKFEERNRL